MSMPRYTVVIQWSDEDQAYVVSLPEWGGCKTHGESYAEAAKNAQEVLEMLVESHDPSSDGPLPTPKLFHFPGADVVNLPEDKATGPRVAKSA
jgi:antitoxin HicB